MKVSEKSLELNIGAEILWTMRNQWGMPKVYLRGLTQREERQEGVDFFAQLDPAVRLVAFQFKAPKGIADGVPYRFTLMRYQHRVLRRLAQRAPNSVFYVLAFYITTEKLQNDVPTLAGDTWLLRIAQMPTGAVFGAGQSTVMRCGAGQAIVNPEYPLLSLRDVSHRNLVGVRPRVFARWYREYRRADQRLPLRQRNSWLARGLRIAIVLPQ